VKWLSQDHGMTDEDDDTPLFIAGHMETLSYGPSWGSIIFLGLVGIALLVAILVFA
jgi:hypothetical protein